MVLDCLDERIELIIDKSIKVDPAELMFWLERFVPGISESFKSADYKIYLSPQNENSLEYDDTNSYLSGIFSEGCESVIAKYVQQIFAKLLLRKKYLLIPGACIQKKGEAVLLLGDYWQGKTSVLMKLVTDLGYSIVSDNYVIIYEGKVVCGTNHISVRKENIELLGTLKGESFIERNNRYFYKSENNKDSYAIRGLATCYINEGDNNFHVVSQEESRWYVFNKFKRVFSGECLLFDGTVPSPAFIDESTQKTISEIVLQLLKQVSLFYLSGSLERIGKFVDTKIWGTGTDYNFIVKLITACPGNCACCKDRRENFKYKDKNRILFDTATFEKICHCIRKVGGTYVCLSGGEPTIVPNLVDYITVAKKAGLSVRINTTGYGITRAKLQEWLDAGLSQVVLSVYSLNEEMTKLLRGSAIMHKKMLCAAEALKQAKENNDFIFIVQSVIMKDNYTEISAIFKFAMEHNADMYWPSYLEDAVNLETVRLTQKEIDDFRSTVLPRMEACVRQSEKSAKIKERITKEIDLIYKKTYPNYVYHDSNIACPWPGRHFTFYPDGIVDPCPGHEYFQSDYQWKIDYDRIEDFFTMDNLEKYMFVQYEYCKYCPQGEHKGICLADQVFHEHSKK